jgi:hypothetical protein
LIERESLATAIRQAQAEASEVVLSLPLRESTLAPLLEKGWSGVGSELGGQPDEVTVQSSCFSYCIMGLRPRFKTPFSQVRDKLVGYAVRPFMLFDRVLAF